ncbi:hypothetical protein BpHYR1_034631 [Brachionus plicatilis]|uniref:Uncharacterized protein n=1 Tax=Brachionus plicatilis TaxID=10195 RepID=A0A3M7R623_BRAPC|nr:hypothetical protein BpHYR1_034631 [Brachionus plicatilis]
MVSTLAVNNSVLNSNFHSAWDRFMNKNALAPSSILRSLNKILVYYVNTARFILQCAIVGRATLSQTMDTKNNCPVLIFNFFKYFTVQIIQFKSI